VLPALALAALAVAALVLGRRRRAAPRLVEVIESTSLGPKRALVVARVGEDLLLLGSSEAGIALLERRAGASAPAAHHAPVAAPTAAIPAAPRAPGRVASLVARLAPSRPPATAPPAFDAFLAESAEDQELRRKIAAGRPGTIR
jgi:flagellar biogenesis protein FliO